MGKWGHGTAKLPFMQYQFQDQWGEDVIEDVWNDFAGNTPGIIFTIWDPSRLTWFSNPMMGGRLQDFLTSGRFKRWGYFPVDAFGIAYKLTGQCADAIAKYDRILAYSIYGSTVLKNTLGRDVDWIPHGYNDKMFQPREKIPGRMTLGVSEDDLVIGMVGTNQARKDWGVAFEAVAHLAQKNPLIKFWVHTDSMDRYWSIPALIMDFGLTNVTRVTFNGQFNSEQLSYLYSACDATFLVSHEGMGYPLVESMACGVPAIHATFGGGSELIPDRNWLVPEVAIRLDTQFNIYRPVFSPRDWAETIHKVLVQAEDGSLKDYCVNSVSHLRWSNLWPSSWKKWFLEGIK